MSPYQNIAPIKTINAKPTIYKLKLLGMVPMRNRTPSKTINARPAISQLKLSDMKSKKNRTPSKTTKPPQMLESRALGKIRIPAKTTNAKSAINQLKLIDIMSKRNRTPSRIINTIPNATLNATPPQILEMRTLDKYKSPAKATKPKTTKPKPSLELTGMKLKRHKIPDEANKTKPPLLLRRIPICCSLVGAKPCPGSIAFGSLEPHSIQ